VIFRVVHGIGSFYVMTANEQFRSMAWRGVRKQKDIIVYGVLLHIKKLSGRSGFGIITMRCGAMCANNIIQRLIG